MAITSENNSRTSRRYTSTQFLYAMTYVFVTLFVLLFLNIYCSRVSQRLFYESKETSMLEKCLLASSEIADLEVLNPGTAAGVVDGLVEISPADSGASDLPKYARVIVTDLSSRVVYDTGGTPAGQFALYPEILQAVSGYDVFSWQFRDGVMHSHAATPVMAAGVTIGTIYITETDFSLGILMQSLLDNILRITLILEAAVILFSLFFSLRFSRRLNHIMSSMKIIQQGDYTHKVDMSGHDELAFLGQEFNDLTEKLQTSEEKRRRFVSDASHELKTPLASIKLLTDSILQNDMDPGTVREFVSDIGDEAERLNRMTAKLLALTKVNHQDTVDCEIIYISPTIKRVARMLSAIAKQNDITIELHLEEDSTILIQDDDLYQIIFNLGENGIKYNTPGGKLTVTLSREDDNAIISIADTGVGIPPDALEHIFERFYRVDKARSRATGGSGLGLAIVKAIAQRNRGDIRVESVLDQGTVFTVTFPVFDAEVDKS